MTSQNRPGRCAWLVFPTAALLLLPGCNGMSETVSPLSKQAVADVRAGLEVSRDVLQAAIESDEDAADLVPSSATAIHGPTVITRPGAYRVTGDFSVDAETGDGVVIRSEHVLLSLGGHTITGPGNKAGRGIVVDHANGVLVTGGTLQNFGIGVTLLASNRSAVRFIRVRGGDEPANPPAGVPPQIGVMLVDSHNNRVARNQLDRINLGIFVRGAGSYDNKVRRNQVSAASHGLLGICYNPAAGEGPVGPSRDDVTENLLDHFGTGIQVSEGSANNRFNRNVIRYLDHAWVDHNGSNEFEKNRTTQVAP